jgi:hypothetical protein
VTKAVTSGGSRSGFLAKMDWPPPILVIVEDGDELQAGAEGFEVLAQGRHSQVVSVLELGDRPLGHLQAPSELGLADRLGVAELEKADLLQCLGPLGSVGLSL